MSPQKTSHTSDNPDKNLKPDLLYSDKAKNFRALHDTFEMIPTPDPITGLTEGLRHFGVANGDRVLVPSFISKGMYEALCSDGLILSWYHINHHLRAEFNPRQLPAAKAVIAINYLGFPQPLEQFREYCRIRNAILVEDHSQGLFNLTCNKPQPGIRGDLGLICYPALDSDISEKAVTLRKASGKFHKDRLTLSPAKTNTKIKPSTELEKFHQQDCQKESERRRQLFQRCYEIASKTPALIPWKHPPTGISPFGFPFFSSDNVYEMIQEKALFEGFSCQNWPDLPPEVLSSCRSFYRTCRLIRF